MAVLFNDKTLKKIFLRSHHAFGRNGAKSDTVLDSSDASQLHASIRWDGGLWELIDHSTNGTMLDGRRVAPNVKRALAVGQKIRFSADGQAAWVVQDLDPPCAMLLSMQEGTPDIALGNFNLLPDEAEPLASVRLSSGGLWLHEADSASLVLREGDRVQVGASVWQFTGSPVMEATDDMRRVCQPNRGDALFHFQVSMDEEHVSLSVTGPGGGIDLGERTHHYGLLTLARRRLGDAGRGLDAASQGWIEIAELSKMLGVEQNHLNMQIFRARSQIARALPQAPDVSEIIERRRCEVRFGAFRFNILRGATMEGSFVP